MDNTTGTTNTMKILVGVLAFIILSMGISAALFYNPDGECSEPQETSAPAGEPSPF